MLCLLGAPTGFLSTPTHAKDEKAASTIPMKMTYSGATWGSAEWKCGNRYYMLAAKGLNECPDYNGEATTRILTKADCDKAVSCSVLLPFTAEPVGMDDPPSAGYPKGCYKYSSTSVWFNGHSSGGPASGSQPICDVTDARPSTTTTTTVAANGASIAVAPYDARVYNLPVSQATYSPEMETQVLYSPVMSKTITLDRPSKVLVLSTLTMLTPNWMMTTLYLSSDGGGETELADARAVGGSGAYEYPNGYVTLKGSYMGSLPAGEHTFALKYKGTPTDGSLFEHAFENYKDSPSLPNVSPNPKEWLNKNIQILIL
jgi:hypothetical protein